jgi:hypothetical protein
MFGTRTIDNTGPKISSLPAGMSVVTPSSTVGPNQ